MPTTLAPPTSEILPDPPLSMYFEERFAILRVLSDLFFVDAPTERPAVLPMQNQYFIQVADLEASVIKDVSLMAGDREFPHDLREELMNTIAVFSLRHPGGNFAVHTVHYLVKTRKSMLLLELAAAMERVRERRVLTRFGLIGDDPRAAVAARDSHDLLFSKSGS